ncbi:MAG: cache domain-containing protein, partial [Bradyrhizobium sp.]|uniref:cache domain-containing protein n=1 Tax=Bradyrhizobium sp. TaxID=376 RepID=UPI003C7C7DB8
MTLLSHFKIRTKLASMVVLAALTVLAIVGVASWLSERRMLDDRVAQMRTAVDMMIGMAQTLQTEVAAGKMTLTDAKTQFRLRGRGMVFNGNQGYPIVYEADSTSLLNYANPQVEGRPSGAKDADGNVIADLQMKAARSSPEGGISSYHFPRPGQKLAIRKVAYARHFAPWDIYVTYGVYVDDIDADVNALLLRLGTIGGGLMLLLASFSWLISRDVVGGLGRLKDRMQGIAGGALETPVTETDRGDEIGRMAETLDVLRQTAITARTLEQEQAASKDRSEAEKREALITLADRFDASVGQLVGMMASGAGELEATAKSMTGTAESTNHRATAVSTAATQASTRVQTVASAAEELSSSITEISRQVAQSAAVTGRAVESAR